MLCFLYRLCAQKHRRFGKEGTQDGGSEKQGRAGPKHRPPLMRVVRDECEVDNSSEEITESITLLDDATSESTKLNGKVFESCGGCKAPNATHRDAKKRSDSQKLVVSLYEAGPQRKGTAQ